MDWIEYLALGLIHEAACEAAVLGRETLDTREHRWALIDELHDQPAPRGWRAQIATATYRTWE